MLLTLHSLLPCAIEMTFAVGVLSIPGAFYSMGLAGGLVSVVGWGALNTCAFLSYFPSLAVD